MLKQIRASVVLFVLLSVLTGVLYPLAVTAIAQSVFPRQAQGSLRPDGHGSDLIGQNFDDPKYFWGRLSATSDANGKALPYDAANSSGSNLGPSNPALVNQVKGRLSALKAADPTDPAPVPVDLVTASASGLDPDISPAAALYQARRVAAARHLSEETVQDLIVRNTTGPTLGVLGDARVNVLRLNSALDAATGH